GRLIPLSLSKAGAAQPFRRKRSGLLDARHSAAPARSIARRSQRADWAQPPVPVAVRLLAGDWRGQFDVACGRAAFGARVAAAGFERRLDLLTLGLALGADESRLGPAL